MSDDTATISIHAAREGSDLAYGVVITRLTISIHAAREGGDDPRRGEKDPQRDFNPRRP